MKTFLKNNLVIFFTLFFLFLLFYQNSTFKTCIIKGCFLFFEQVFPSLFPMFIINDILMNYNFFSIIEKSINKIFQKIFGFSTMASYIFVMSLFSGTPTNAYLITNLVKEKKINQKDAAIILSYSCFLNPLFLYNMLNAIFHNTHITFKIILIHYTLNFITALFFNKYPYEKRNFFTSNPKPFTKVLANSLKRSTNTFFLILGTIIFYFILCEGISMFLNSPILNCLINGVLETTGGLSKLILLNINHHLKEILACFFISFGGLSIHTQIKNIIEEENISYKFFFCSKLIQGILSTLICMIIP